jgi:GT2 family glycosyltransferase
MDISMVIVTYNNRGFISECIGQIKKHLPKELVCEIIAVDNNSSDGTPSALRAIADVQIISNKRNIGFGAANNIGIGASRGKYILLLNPDIFVHEGAFEKLYEFMEQNDGVAVCGPRLIYPDGTDQASANRWPRCFATPLVQRTFLGNTAWGRRIKAKYRLEGLAKDRPSLVPWLVGAALFIRRESLKSVGGGFDERFFMYYEDIDLCRQFWQAGLCVAYVPLSAMTHFHRRESARGGFKIFTNRVYRIHLLSYFKYFIKWRGAKEPAVTKLAVKF